VSSIERGRSRMKSAATTVEAYLAELPQDRRAVIEAVRKVILENLDEGYEEGIQYGMIGYYVPHRVFAAGYHCDPRQPLPFGALASQKGYMSLYLMCIYGHESLRSWFEEAEVPSEASDGPPTSRAALERPFPTTQWSPLLAFPRELQRGQDIVERQVGLVLGYDCLGLGGRPSKRPGRLEDPIARSSDRAWPVDLLGEVQPILRPPKTGIGRPQPPRSRQRRRYPTCDGAVAP
jgi:hypothetical protein